MEIVESSKWFESFLIGKMMNKFLWFVGLLVAGISGQVSGQSAIIRGELAPGVYRNIPVDTNNYLYVNCPGCTGASAPTGANNADNVVPVATGLTAAATYLFGFDGTNWDRLRLDASTGNLNVNCVVGCAGGTASNASSGVATSSTNGTSNAWNYGFNGTTWDQLQVDGSKYLKVTNLTAIPTGSNVIGAITQSGTWNLNNISGTISLPTGASTAAKQPALGTAGVPSADVISIQGVSGMSPVQVSGTVTATGTIAATQSGTWTVQPGNTANTTAWKVDGSAVTQPISAVSLPLPTLASTSTKQSDGSQKTQIVDGSGNVIASTSNNLNVQCANCSGSGVSTADQATFTAGTSLFAGSGGFFQTTATSNALTNGQQGMLQLTAQRAAFTNLRNASGTEIGTSTTPVQVSLANTAANATAVKVDGSAVTQPVSLTSTTITGTVAATQSGTWTNTVTQATASNLNAAVVGTGTAGSAAGGILTVQGVASMTKLLVTPDSVALPANQSVNVAQINGVTTLMGNGTTGTGSQRVTIASDNTAFSVNAAATLGAETTKVIGTVRTLGNAGAILDAATGAAPPANAILHAGLGSGATGGLMVGIAVADGFFNVNISTATTTLLITGVSGRHVRISSIDLVTAAANNVALISGTGATCGTGTAAIVGTTAATGWNFAANGGLTKGTGLGTILRTVATGDSICAITSAATQLSGSIAYSIW